MNKEKSEKEKERENDREKRETKRKAKVLGDSLLDREFFGGDRLWFMLFHSKLLIAIDMYLGSIVKSSICLIVCLHDVIS